MPANSQIAQLLHEIAVLTELEEENRGSFRARAYHNAVRALEGETRDVTQLTAEELTAIKGIGKAIAGKIREYAEIGSIAKLEQLRSRFPPGYVELTRIPGLGPKTLSMLRDELGVTTLDGLKEAIAQEKLRDLPGLGAKTEENLARDIERLGLVGKEVRTPIIDALPMARRIVADLAEVPEVQRVEHAGSLRRFRETIADIDIVVASDDPGPVMRAFVGLPVVREVTAHGAKKSSVLTARNVQIDLRVVAPDQWGAALLYFTGSKAHNIQVRERAVRRGLTLNEYGLFHVEEDEDGTTTVGDLVASETEADVYAALDLAWIPPGLREGIGEVEGAEGDAIGEFATVDEVIGDLHVHTDLSGDGRASLEEMVAAAVARGCRYIAITDHGEDLSINGASREQMLAQRERIREVEAGYDDLTILHGSELNIDLEGGLDYDHEFLMGFDWCIASVHSHFKLDRDQQTERVITAMRHPAVNAIGHLQGRRVGKRPPIDLDLEAVMDAAAETGTAIEINSNLDRLDATAEALLVARAKDVVFVINTDAHATHELAFVEHGIRQAERGWVTKDRIANTWDPQRFLDWVAAKRRS
ncbi:MAG: DNA polymerase/3'-5' exonuclease PolX [Actinobacteria bacterium]|nr:DNA polymerase/3'-5' exonuclease PolX [Actinomycetota bacterium]